MKDTEYFDDRMYLYTNKKLKQILADLAEKSGMTQYFIVDIALREYIEKNGFQVHDSPKRPILA